jgi:predicted dehydrogenase
MINWGIIGAGDVCEVKSGPAFYKIEGSTLAAVMRRDKDKAADFAQRHHVAAYYTSVEDLLADANVNAIYVATPPHLHKQYAIQALKSGRPVYVEKPMALNYAECKEMIQTADECGQKLFVAYYRRSLPYFLKVKELIDKKFIGKPVAVNVKQFRAPSSSDFEEERQTWRVKSDIAGGGYFYDLAPHTIDMLDFLLGGISDAKGYTNNLGLLYKAEDTVSASFLFENGALGTGIWSFVTDASSNIDSVEILGTKGKIQFAIFDFTPIKLTDSEGEQVFETENPQHIQQPLIETVVEELSGKGNCPSTALSGARTSWVIDRIFGNI